MDLALKCEAECGCDKIATAYVKTERRAVVTGNMYKSISFYCPDHKSKEGHGRCIPLIWEGRIVDSEAMEAYRGRSERKQFVHLTTEGNKSS